MQTPKKTTSGRLGRPRSKHPRDFAVPIRFSNLELGIIDAAAKAGGLPRSTLIREAAMTEAKSRLARLGIKSRD